MNDVIHISSLLVSVRPDAARDVAEKIRGMVIAEVAHIDAQGKLIVTLETSNESEIVDALGDIQLIDGVVSAALVYHQSDTNDALETIR